MLLYYQLVSSTGGGNTGTVTTTPTSRTIVLSAAGTSQEKADIFAESMDPYEMMDYAIDVTNLLASGETVSAYSVTLPAESDLLGLEIGTVGIVGNLITIWLSIIAAEQQNSSYSGVGVTLPITVSLTSSGGRKRQRTIAVRVNQR